MAASDPTPYVATPTGTLQGVAAFSWDGSAWQPSGRAGPDVATPTGVLQGVAPFSWSGSAWTPAGRAQPGVATPSGVLDGVAVYTWSGSAWTPASGTATPSTPSGALRGVAAFGWDGSAWQPAAQARASVPTPYGVLDGVAFFNWGGTAWTAGAAVPPGVTLDLSFFGPTLDPSLTFTRASTATYFDASGVMQTAAMNTAFPSADFTNYTKNGVAVTRTGTAAPDGTALNLMTDDTSTGAHCIYGGSPATTAATWVASVFVRAGTQRYIGLRGESAGASGSPWITFDTQTQTINANTVVTASGFSAVGGGTYRIWLSWPGTVIASGNIIIAGSNVATSPLPQSGVLGNSYTGTGQTWYAWGLQVELGATPSAYIPTTTAANGAPRFDYDPVTHAALGLLIEEQRINGIFPSVLGAGWTVQTATQALGGSVTVPDGTISTTTLVSASNTTSAVRGYLGPAVTTVATTAYSATAFMRKAPTSNAYIQINGGGAAGVAYFDLTNGTAVVGADLAGGLTNKSVTITNAGNGWYRCTYTFTTTGTGTTTTMYVGPCTTVSSSGDNRAYVGVVGQGIYAWGAQLEAGAFPTSYIPTTAVAVTRSADQCWIPPANMGFYVSPGGSWEAEFICRDTDTANAVIMGQHAGSSGIPVPMYLANPQRLAQWDTVGILSTANAITTGAVSKAATTLGAGAGTGCLNGGTVASAAGFTNGYPALATAGVGFLTPYSGASAENVGSGYIRRVRYWPRVLSNAELQSVTT